MSKDEHADPPRAKASHMETLGPPQIPAVLKAFREAEGWSQAEMAARLTAATGRQTPLTPQAVNAYEAADKYPGERVIAAYAKALRFDDMAAFLTAIANHLRHGERASCLASTPTFGCIPRDAVMEPAGTWSMCAGK